MAAVGGSRHVKHSTKPAAQRPIDLVGFLFVLPFLLFYAAFWCGR